MWANPDFARVAATEKPGWHPPHRDPESLEFLATVTDMIRETSEDSWWEGPTFRSPDGSRHCVLSHVFERLGPEAYERFEDEWSTSYVIGASVNDRPTEAYPQEHPKERVLAYLDALREGRELDTQSSMALQALEAGILE